MPLLAVEYWHVGVFLQLLLSSWKRSLVPGICGVIAGFIYKSNVLGIRRVKVCKICDSLTLPFLTGIACRMIHLFVIFMFVLQFPEQLAAATARLFAPFMSGMSSPSTNTRVNASREATVTAPPARPFEVCKVWELYIAPQSSACAAVKGISLFFLCGSCFCKITEMISSMNFRIALLRQHPP